MLGNKFFYSLLAVFLLTSCKEEASRNFFAADGITVGEPAWREPNLVFVPLDFKTDPVHCCCQGSWVETHAAWHGVPVESLSATRVSSTVVSHDESTLWVTVSPGRSSLYGQTPGRLYEIDIESGPALNGRHQLLW